MGVIPVEFDLSFSDDGHRLVYDLYGSSAAPLVVYLHGLLLDSELNRGIAQALAEQGNRVALLDLLGHGRSDKPTHASTYRIDSYADQVIAPARPPRREQSRPRGHLARRQRQLVRGGPLPERVQALVLEMPVLERAVPAAAMMFVPMVSRPITGGGC